MMRMRVHKDLHAEPQRTQSFPYTVMARLVRAIHVFNSTRSPNQIMLDQPAHDVRSTFFSGSAMREIIEILYSLLSTFRTFVVTGVRELSFSEWVMIGLALLQICVAALTQSGWGKRRKD